MSTKSKIQNLAPKMIPTDMLGNELEQASQHAVVATIGISSDGKQATLSAIPTSAIETARKDGEVKVRVSFNNDYHYLGGIGTFGDMSHLVGEDSVGRIPGFNAIAATVANKLGSTERTILARRNSPSASWVNPGGKAEQFTPFTTSASARLSAMAVGDQLLEANGKGIRYIAVDAVRRFARGERVNQDEAWTNMEVQYGDEAALGRYYGKRAILALKTGGLAALKVEQKGDELTAEYDEDSAWPTDGAVFGLLQGTKDVVFAIEDVGSDGATIRLMAVSSLPPTVQAAFGFSR